MFACLGDNCCNTDGQNLAERWGALILRTVNETFQNEPKHLYILIPNMSLNSNSLEDEEYLHHLETLHM